MTTRTGQQQLRAMSEELRDNRAIHLNLLDHYDVFRFTGGDIPSERWNVVALTSFLRQPAPAAEGTVKVVEQYLHLIQNFTDLGQEVAKCKGPKSLRARHEFAARFSVDSAKFQSLGNSLELALHESALAGLRP